MRVTSRSRPELSTPLNTSWYVPAGVLPPILSLNLTLVSVVLIGSAGLGLMPAWGAGGVTVTLPVNPPLLLIVIGTTTFAPAWPVRVDWSRLREKSGPGAVMVKVMEGEVPPPGARSKMETCTVPWVVRSEAGMSASISVALTKVVGLSSPSHAMVVVGVNPAALGVSPEELLRPGGVIFTLTPDPPAGAELGVALIGASVLLPA